MRAKRGLALLLGGALLWVLWQPPIPESGFSYAVREGDRVWRVQRFFRSSPVAGARLGTVEGLSPTFVAWATITPSDAVEGEPEGVCFFDGDGDFSGFLPLSGERLQALEALRIEGDSLLLALSGPGGSRELVVPLEEARLSWSRGGCDTFRESRWE